MNEEELILTEPSYLTCEINGSQFILQDGQIKFDNIDNESLNIIKENNKIDNPVIVCIEGQMYSLQVEEPNVVTENLKSNDSLIDDTSNVTLDVLTETNDDAESTEHQIEQNDSTQIINNHEKIDAMDFVEVVTAFKCKICPYTTQDRTELLSHIENIHANPTPQVDDNNINTQKQNDDVKLLYMCGECSNCFETIENCRQHMINDHKLMDKKLENQLTPTTTAPDINKTINQTNDKNINETDKSNIIKDNKNIKCRINGCIYKFSTNEMMEKHVSYHIESSQNIFKCTLCQDIKFTKWKVCNLHLWKSHNIDIDLLSCTLCNYKTISAVKLLNHKKVHSDRRDFKCQDCDKCFKQSNQLRNHRVIHLDRKSIDLPRWYTSKTCQLCNKTYADSKCLKNHMQSVHLKLKPYVCNICGHSSARKAMLQMHKRQHTGDKPFNCDICDYKTGDHNSLRRHIMRHTGYRDYHCPHCSYSAIQSSSYKNHLRSKHPDLSGIFVCNKCPFKTVRNDTFIEHINEHKKTDNNNKTVNSSTDAVDAVDTVDTVDTVDNNFKVFEGNIAAAKLVYSYFGATSDVEKTSLMSSSTSADGTSQTITIKIPSKNKDSSSTSLLNNQNDDEDDETMDYYLKTGHDEEENIDTGGITIPADPDDDYIMLNIES